jgi:tetratricopeptide (TPR) repeat protein
MKKNGRKVRHKPWWVVVIAISLIAALGYCGVRTYKTLKKSEPAPENLPIKEINICEITPEPPLEPGKCVVLSENIQEEKNDKEIIAMGRKMLGRCKDNFHFRTFTISKYYIARAYIREAGNECAKCYSEEQRADMRTFAYIMLHGLLKELNESIFGVDLEYLKTGVYLQFSYIEMHNPKKDAFTIMKALDYLEEAKKLEKARAEPNKVSLNTIKTSRGYALAVLYRHTKNKAHIEEALKISKEVVKDNPSDACDWNTLGIVQHIAGDKIDAVESLKIAVRLDPSNPQFQKNMSDIAGDAGITIASSP